MQIISTTHYLHNYIYRKNISIFCFYVINIYITTLLFIKEKIDYYHKTISIAIFKYYFINTPNLYNKQYDNFISGVRIGRSNRNKSSF